MYIQNENEVEVLPNNVILQNDVENSTPMHVLLAIFEDIKNIKGELASLNVKIDKLLEKSSVNSQENFNLNLTANTQFPLKDVPGMDVLNTELFSIEFKTEMVSLYDLYSNYFAQTFVTILKIVDSTFIFNRRER